MATTYILELIQTIFISHDAFVAYGIGFGDFEAVDHIKLTWLVVPFLSGISSYLFGSLRQCLFLNTVTASCIVQLFYAYRIMVLSNTKATPALITIVWIIYNHLLTFSNPSQKLSLAGMGGGLSTGIKSYQLGYLSKFGVTSVFISVGVSFIGVITPASVHHPSHRSGGHAASCVT